MNKIYFAVLILLLSCQSAMAYTDQYGRKHYTVAIHATNPLSALTKYGGQVENRLGNVSYLFSYTKYTGAYPGFQIGMEFHKYFRARSKHQYYLYFKGLLGDAGFDSRKLAIYGDKSNILIGTFDENLKFKSGYTYGGGGAGFGRRYNFGSLFIRWNLGAKACALIGEVPVIEKNMYRLMFATGPASILEYNVHIGLQF